MACQYLADQPTNTQHKKDGKKHARDNIEGELAVLDIPLVVFAALYPKGCGEGAEQYLPQLGFMAIAKVWELAFDLAV